MALSGGADKYTVLLEGKETVSRATRVARKELDKLGGPGMVKATRELNKVQREIKLIGKVAKKSTPLFSKFTKGIALGNIAANVATAAFRGLKSMITGVIDAGILHEKVWNDVAAGLRRHGKEVDNNLLKIQRFSDEMQTMSGESDESIGKMVQGFLDYGQTVDEAMSTTRVAMDLAAGSGMELKAAMELLAKAAVGYTGTLSRYGIIIDENIPKAEKFAAAIEQINERFGGAATARADTFAVKMSLITERFGDLQEEIFKLIAPALMIGVNVLTSAIAGLGSAVEFLQDPIGTLTGKTDDLTVAVSKDELRKGLAIIEAHFKALGGDQPIIKNMEDYASALERIAQAKIAEQIGEFELDLSKLRFSFDNVTDATDAAGVSTSHLYREYQDMTFMGTEAANALIRGYDTMDEGAREASKADLLLQEVLKEKIEVLDDTEQTFTSSNKRMVEGMAGLLTTIEVSYGTRKTLHKQLMIALGEQEEELTVSTLGAFAVVTKEVENKYERMRRVAEVASGAMEGAMGNASRRMIGSLKFLQTQSTGVFKNMASDFSQMFLEEVTRQLMIWIAKWIAMLIFFDNPRNDRMAIQSGRDFIDYFNQGISEGMPSIQAGRTGALATPIPLLSAGGGGGVTTINLNFTGPVTSEAFVRDVVAPVIEQVVRDGGSDITLSSELLTGDRDVIL